MEPSPCDSIPPQDFEHTKLKGTHIIHRSSADTFLFVNAEEKRKKKLRVSLPRIPISKTRAKSTDPCQLQSRVKQFIQTDRLKESHSSRTITRDVSHLQDILTKLPSDRDRSFKEVIIGKQDSTHFLPTDITYLQKLLSNTDDLGIPITMNHYGLPEHLNCKKESCLDKASQQTNMYKSRTPSPIRSPHIESEKFIDKILMSETSNRKRINFINLGNPTGRQEVENLKKWLDHMQEEYLGDIENSINNGMSVPEDKLKKAYTVYYTSLKELIRQVSVHCIDRGELLRQNVEKLSGYWSKTSQNIMNSAQQEKDKYTEELNELRNTNSKQLLNYQIKINELTENIHKSKAVKEKLNQDLESLKKFVVNLQKEYNKAKQEIRVRRQMASPVKVVQPARQGYHDGLRIQAKRLPKEFFSINEEKGNKTSSSIENDARIDATLQTEENDIDILCTEENDINILYTEENVGSLTEIPQQLNTDQAKLESSINSKSSLMVISETVTYTISQSLCPNNMYPCASLSETLVSDLTEGCKFTLSSNDQKSQACETRGKYSVRQLSSTSFVSTSTEAKLSHAKSQSFNYRPNYDPTPTRTNFLKQQVNSKGINIAEEIKSKVSNQKQSKDNISASKINSKGQGNARCRDVKKSDKDNLQHTIEDMIVKEVLKQQTALLDIKKQLKTEKDKLNDIVSQITQKSKQLETLNTSSSKPDTLIKPVKLNQKSSLFQKQSIFPTQEPSKLSKSTHEKSELPKISISDSNSDIYNKISPDSLNFAKKLIKRFEGPETTNDLDKSINFLNLIPQGSDAKSWRAGFNVGYDHGRREAQNDELDLGFDKGFAQGYRKGISEQDIEQDKSESSPEKSCRNSSQTDLKKLKNYHSIHETEEKSENEDQKPSRAQTESILSNSSIFKERNPRSRRTTKVIEFNFSSREPVVKKSNPAKKILNNFLTQKSSAIYSYATISKNMLYRVISSVYQTAITKIGSDEHFDSLLNLIYEDILNKYGFRNVADRKFKEFISSAIFHSKNLRAKILLKLLGIGFTIDHRSYSEVSCKLYMEVLHFMHHTNIGIIVASDESADRQMYPSLRAYECLKEKFESMFEKPVIQRIANLIENNSVADPKRINKSGLIELELFMEGLMDAYEDYQDIILEGVEFALSALYHDKEPKFITKTDAHFLIRNINPYKYSILQKKIDNEVQFFYKENESADEEYIQIKSFKKLCILNYCLSIKDANQIYKPDPDSYKLTLNHIRKISQEEALNVFNSMPEGGEVKYRTYSAAQWRKIIEQIDSIFDTDARFLLWKLIECEVNYLRSERGRT